MKQVSDNYIVKDITDSINLTPNGSDCAYYSYDADIFF